MGADRQMRERPRRTFPRGVVFDRGFSAAIIAGGAHRPGGCAYLGATRMWSVVTVTDHAGWCTEPGEPIGPMPRGEGRCAGERIHSKSRRNLPVGVCFH